MRRFRLGVGLGFAVGYYLGTRAGRERYTQLNRAIDRLRHGFAKPVGQPLDTPEESLPFGAACASRIGVEKSAQASVSLEDLPAELRSRVLAATAHAQYRDIDRREGEQGRDEEYEVYALAGDRFVHMRLALRPDGSVAEATETLLRNQIVNVLTGENQASLEVRDETGLRRVSVPLGFVAALTDPDP